jgi:hypothetical protein
VREIGISAKTNLPIRHDFVDVRGSLLIEEEEEDDDDDDDDDDSPDDVDPPSDGSANAMPGMDAIAAPTPNVTANAPTRPTYLAWPMTVSLRSLAPNRHLHTLATNRAVRCESGPPKNNALHVVVRAESTNWMIEPTPAELVHRRSRAVR